MLLNSALFYPVFYTVFYTVFFRFLTADISRYLSVGFSFC